MLISTVSIIVAICALSHARPDFFRPGVQQMHIDNSVVEEENIMTAEGVFYDHELFQFMRVNFKPVMADAGSLGGSFKWQDCGNSTAEILHINGLAVTPDPLRLPGNIGLKFDVDFKQTVDAPLKLSLKIEKHEGPIWITVPCIGGIGSCTYDDLCEKLSGAVCPPPFDEHKIPCKCPFSQGHYSLPTSTFQLDVGEIPSGSYYAKAEISYQSKPVTCVEMYFAIE